MAKKYVVGARASRLSLAQTEIVITCLKATNPGSDYEIKTITTHGDTDTRPLFSMDQKGIFEKEIDRAVAHGEVDFAVHSLKDVPSVIDPSLVIACVPKRIPANDVLVSRDGSALDSIKSSAIIGTSSLRRAVQISQKRPDVVIKPIRGNIDTRIRRVRDGEYDAIVLAHAGIIRLGMCADTKFSILPTDEFIPSPGQGAIAVVARAGSRGVEDNNNADDVIIRMLKKIEDRDSRQAVQAERALSGVVDSGCRFPVGAYAQLSAPDMLRLSAAAFSLDGKTSLRASRIGSLHDPCLLGKMVGEDLRKHGVQDLALNWRQQVLEWNKI